MIKLQRKLTSGLQVYIFLADQLISVCQVKIEKIDACCWNSVPRHQRKSKMKFPTCSACDLVCDLSPCLNLACSLLIWSWMQKTVMYAAVAFCCCAILSWKWENTHFDFPYIMTYLNGALATFSVPMTGRTGCFQSYLRVTYGKFGHKLLHSPPTQLRQAVFGTNPGSNKRKPFSYFLFVFIL